MVPWCRGAVVPWCRGAVVPWCRGAVVPWCRGGVVEWWSGVMVKHADHNAGVLSSIPPCVTIEMPLVRKAMGSHLMKSTSLEKNSEPCLWFLLRSKSSILWDFMNILFCEEGNGNPPHKIYFLRKKLRALSLVSATLEVEYPMGFYEHSFLWGRQR